ncbi:hypothetical protein GGQ60_004079 [Pedobacter zeae]|uniref:Uncharacterized protein n=1 Tax=Pedobacter zeae TaxID=1737356 RepID=A0A7W6KDY8_9SPHI|nr:hypothetical protein [Pedobacter zeae]
MWRHEPWLREINHVYFWSALLVPYTQFLPVLRLYAFPKVRDTSLLPTGARWPKQHPIFTATGAEPVFLNQIERNSPDPDFSSGEDYK